MSYSFQLLSTRLVCTLALLTLAACSSSSPKSPKSPKPLARTTTTRSGITELHLLTMPIALNLDASPGDDGIAIKLFANFAGAIKPVAIRSGEIELLLFDGLLQPGSTVPAPAFTWHFTSQQLKQFENKSLLGVGYQLTLRWDRFKPSSERITVVARYALGQGRFLYSSPSVIACSSTH